MIKIFADSSFFIALFNPQDTLRVPALTVKERLEKEGDFVVISNFIFSETVTVLSQKVGREAAVLIGQYLISDENIEIVYVDEQLNKASWENFQEIKKKNMSFVDCSSLAVMQSEGINKFLTFDLEDFSSLRKKYSFGFY